MKTYSPFCAICSSEVGPFMEQAIGKNDALVKVCASCYTAPAVTKVGPELAYVPSGGLPRNQDSHRGMVKAIGADTARKAAILEHQRTSSNDPKGKRDEALGFRAEGRQKTLRGNYNRRHKRR